MPAPSAVDAPPRSGPLASGCSTLEMDVDPAFASFPAGDAAAAGLHSVDECVRADADADGPCGAIRRSLHDVSSARIRMYHHQCDQRLQHTLGLLREREERGQWTHSSNSSSTSRGRGSSAGSGPRGRGRSSSSASSSTSSTQWKLLRESSDIRVFRARHAPAGRATPVMAIGTVHGALVDVMNGLYADSTREARVLHTLLSRRFVDARVLRVDKHASEPRPFQFAGVTWTAVKPPGLGLCKLRDFLCFKKTDCVRDDLDNDLGFLVLQSIDPIDDFERASGPLPSPLRPSAARPSSTQSTRYVRGYMSLAVVFKRVDEDRVALFAHGELSPNGHVPPLLRDLLLGDILTSFANTVRTGEAKNLTALLHAPTLPLLQSRAALAAKSAAASGHKQRCGVCARAMYFWDGPRPCRSCWGLTCRTCRVTRPIFCAHSHDPAGAVEACMETFCLQCVCSVTPNAGALVNARLLARLEKKRKRAPPTRPSNRAALLGDRSLSLTGSFPVIPLSADDESHSHINGHGATSSISVTSSRPESDKHQQMRLSLNPRPTKRRYDRPSYDKTSAGTVHSADLLEVLEHNEQFQVDDMDRTPLDAFSTVSSSQGAASLVSFSSTDLLQAPSTTYSTSRSFRADSSSIGPGSFRRLTSTGSATQQPSFNQYHLGTNNPPTSLQRRRSVRRQQQQQQQQQAILALAAALQRKDSMQQQRQQKRSKPKRRVSQEQENDDEYYQQRLRELLRTAASSRSLALVSDVSSQTTSQPVSQRSRRRRAFDY